MRKVTLLIASAFHLLDDLLQFFRHRRESVRGAIASHRRPPWRPRCWTLAASASLFGKSSRKWPPRLSLRSSAERVIASDTVRRCLRSSAVCQPGLYSRLPETAVLAGALPELAETIERPCHFVFAADDADQFLHHALQLVLDLIGPFGTAAAGAALERLERLRGGFFDLRIVDTGRRNFPSRIWRRIHRRACRRPCRSESELPPRRFAPWRPAAHSPAAKRPGTLDIWVSPLTRTPPMT